MKKYGLLGLVIVLLLVPYLTRLSSQLEEVVVTQTTDSWAGFNLYFQDGHTVGFKSDFTLQIEVVNGVLNGTGGRLLVYDRRGFLSFNASENSTITLSSPDGGSFDLDIQGADFSRHEGEVYQAFISSGNTIVIIWGWRIPSWVGQYTMLTLGLSGLFLMVASPSWVAYQLRKGGIKPEDFERMMYGFILFCVGFGLLVMWLWSG